MDTKNLSKKTKLRLLILACLLVASMPLYKGFLANVVEHQVAFACDDSGKCNKEALLLTGDIVPPSVFRTAIGLIYARLSGVKTVCMSSSGGNLDDALTLARIINWLRMDTCLALSYKPANGGQEIRGLCQSSCTWLILGGKHRYLMDDRVILGFHASRYSTGEPEPDDLPKLQTVIRSLEGDAKKSGELTSLASWTFAQGHTSKTTDRTAHEVQSLYPYFTDIISWRTAPAQTCGLPSPG